MKNKEIRSLTWKHFWKRKREEVWEWVKQYSCVFLFIQWLLLLIIGTSLYISLDGIPAINFYLGRILLYVFCIETIIFTLSIINFHLMKWLRLNWKLATKDAIKELNLKGRK